MIEPIQIVFILFALFGLRYSEGQIKSKEFAFWLVLWVAAIVAIAIPRTVSYISNTFGIGRPADLVIYVAVILLFYMVFRMYVAIDNIEQKITTVVREVAIKRKKK
jgi:small membrane protein